MNQGHCPLIQILLIEILVFDHVEVHEVAQVCASVPSGIIGVHVDFSQLLDHLVLVCGICLRSRGGCSKIRSRIIIMVAVCWGGFDSRKWERVGDFKSCCFIHADQKTGRGCREGLRAVFYYLHDHLI